MLNLCDFWLEQNEENYLDWVLGVQLLILVAMLKNRRNNKTTAKVKRELLERLTKRQQERPGDDLAFIDETSDLCIHQQRQMEGFFS